MRPGQKLNAQLGFLAAAGIVVGLLTYGVVVFRDFDAGKDILVRNDLRALATLDAKLDADLLEARDGLRPNYDEVVDTARALNSAVRALDAGRLGEMRAANTKIDEAFQKLDEQLRTKSGLLDEIKFRHSVAVNSSRFFPQALAEVTATNPSIQQARSALESGILTYILTFGTNQEELDTLVRQLKSQTPGSTNTELQIAVLHAAKLAAVFPALDRDTHTLLDVPSAATISALTGEYNRERSTLEKRANWIRLALAAMSIVLLLSFALILRQIWRTNASAQRFVPTKLLDILGRSSLADVKRGDAVAAEMHILFADIRRFTKLIENWAPVEAFAFMNEYLAAMGAPIARHRGFITEYRGDGIFAIFPGKAEDAVHAALGMLEALAQLNLGRADPVEIGVGVHSGDVILGTFGATDRMSAGVIGAAVVMAARLEGLTKQYKAPLLISEATRQRLSAPELRLRQIDEVQVVGSSAPSFIYDVPRAEVVAAYVEAMSLYRARQFTEARTRFEEITGDPVAAALALRCSQYQRTPPPENWKGVFEASEK